jgi:L-seryl-tRNA(Ser) seleniumtransferase
MTDPRRRLPSVDHLLRLPGIAALLERHPRNLVVATIRETLEQARSNPDPLPLDWEPTIETRLAERSAASLFPVINATGVVLHTNLGRAPLAASARHAIQQIAEGYSNLELDIATGSRGSRLDHSASLLAELSGAEAGFAVNNAAGALVLALNGLAASREVIISRGELVEIGGSFRIPDILEKSGAVLREVGTTNRTHLADYRAACSERTGAILVVHRSNFAMEGFVTSPHPAEIGELARAGKIPFVFDIGSGLLTSLDLPGLTGEPTVIEAARQADLVIFSGDKLLGGPQAGCLVGREKLIGTLRKNPFARALRADKLTLAALEATLRLYRDPTRARREIPVLTMLCLTGEELARRAGQLAALVPPPFEPRLQAGQSAVGGGAFPRADLPTTVVTFEAPATGAAAAALALRAGQPSIVVRVESDRVVLDPRTIPLDRFPEVAAGLSRLVG